MLKCDIALQLLRERQIEEGMSDASTMMFPDAAKAVERIERAVKDGERIAIFGDYDCDGITASALLIRMLRRRRHEPIVRLPHRVHDGYGLKPQHIDEFLQKKVTLLLTADTGISAQPVIAHALEEGMDVIVFDHHEPIGEPPSASAIIHPAFVPGFAGPSPCAAGVVFHFLSAIEGKSWEGHDEDLALAMVGTVADLVPLRGANRKLVRDGLQALTRLQNAPLAILAAHVQSSDRPLSSVDIAFRIAPRINAAGRMADPMLGLQALLEGGGALLALEALNAKRQAHTMTAIDTALGALGTGPMPSFLMATDATYQPGIIGLIAGKLTERFGRPSMAVCTQGDECMASLRSPPTYSIIEGLRRASPLLTSFGGHRQAAGCTFPKNNLEHLTEHLQKDIEASVPADDLLPMLSIDASLDLSSVSLPLIRSLATLEPFGQENPEPQFFLPGVTLSSIRTAGQEGQHLQALASGRKVIGFGLGEWIEHTHQPLDLVCRLSVDKWNGYEQPQLQVVDMRACI